MTSENFTSPPLQSVSHGERDPESRKQNLDSCSPKGPGTSPGRIWDKLRGNDGPELARVSPSTLSGYTMGNSE